MRSEPGRREAGSEQGPVLTSMDMPPAEPTRRLHRVLDETNRRLRAALRIEALLGATVVVLIALCVGGLLGVWRSSLDRILLAELTLVALGLSFVAYRFWVQRRRSLTGPKETAAWLDEALSVDAVNPEVSFRSAVELDRDRGRYAESEVLVDLAVARAADEASRLSPAVLVRRRTAQRRVRLFYAVASVAGLLTLLGLLRPDGLARALTAYRSFASLEEVLSPLAPEPELGDILLTYRYPAYAERQTRTLRSLTGDIRALPGTEVTIETHSGSPLSEATLLVEPAGAPEEAQKTPFSIDGHSLRATLIVSRSGKWKLHAKTHKGELLEQRRGQSIELEADLAPEVKLERPTEPSLQVNEKDTLTLGFEARDDFALGDVQVAWRVLGTAREGTVPLTSAARGRALYRGEAKLELAKLALEPGDRVAYSVEALDNDTVSGPKVGGSETKELVVYSKDAHHREVLAMQEKALDELVHVLGDNLDTLFGPREEAAYAAMLEVSKGIVQRAKATGTLMKEVAEAIRKDPLGREAVATAFERARSELLQDARMKERALRDAERFFHTAHRVGPPETQRVRRDQGKMIDGLEKNVVYLADLLSDQRMIDAENLTKALREQQQELRKVLEDYKNAPSEEKRQILEEAMREIRRRIEEISRDLARVKGSIPTDFVNPDALNAPDSMEAMDRIQEMVEQGNLDGAMNELESMLKNTESMIAELQEGRDELGNREYSEVTEIAEQLWKELESVSNDQDELTKRNDQVSEALRDRMKDRLGDPSAFIEKQLDRLADAAKAIERAEPGAQNPGGGEAYESLLQRMADTGQALKAEDFGAAQEMIEQALQNLRQVQEESARRLDQARRFGDWFGGEKQIADAIRDLDRASPKLEAVAQDIEKLMPKPAEMLSKNERRELDRLAERQAEIEDRARGVGQKLQQLQELLPVVGEGTQQLLEDAKGAMKNAEQGLRQGDSPGASGDQRRALDALEALKKQLQEMSQGGGGGGGSGVPLPFGPGSDGEPGGESDGRRMNDQKVEIPKPEQFQAPAEFREDILDAAKKGTVDSYRDAVRRYYEEIIK